MFKKHLKKFLIPLFLAATLATGYFVLFDRDRALTAKADYLRLTETTDYYHIQSGTYGIRLWKSSIDYYYEIYDDNGVNIAGPFGGTSWVRDSGGVNYYLNYDANRSVTLIDNSKNRVTIKISGKFDSSYEASDDYLTDGSSEVTVDQYFYIYPQYFNLEIQTDFQDGVNLGSNYYGLFVFDQYEGYYDSGQLYAGTTTGETLVSNYSNSNTDYSARLATSTPDFQITKLIEPLNGTSTFSFHQYTESTWQGVRLRLGNGELKGKFTGVFNIRPKINTTASSRLAWAQQMLAMDVGEFSVGSAVNDLSGEVYQAYTAGGVYNVSADNNQAEFTVHANATNTWATLSATSTGGGTTLSIDNDQGLEDLSGASSSWAYVGNRKPYGSFDVSDPDVLFYWDMNSTGTAVSKGIGPIDFLNDHLVLVDGVAGGAISLETIWDRGSIPYQNFNSKKGSIAFWYRNASSTTHDYQYLIQHGSTASERGELYLLYDKSINNISVVINNTSVIFPTNINDYLFLDDMNWHFVRLNYDSINNLTEVYIDGKLVIQSTIEFPELELYTDISIFWSDGNLLTYQIDEFYISSDPDQPDGPSYFDTIKYYDVSGGQLTGIPETGPGSLKWNHPINSPVWQTQREEPVFAVRDWSPKTRSTSTGEYVDHLVLDLPLDGTGKNENAGKVYDKVSGEWIGSVVANGLNWVQGRQGNALEINPSVWQTVTYVSVPSTGIDAKRGTIEFDYRYVGGDMYYDSMFGLGSANGEFAFHYNESNWCFEYNQTNTNCVSKSLLDDGEWHHLRITWDQPNSYFTLLFDNDQSATTTTISEAVFDTDLVVGNRTFNNNNRPMHGQIDNFRVYNDVILPYGAFYTGEPNDGHYANAHPDLIDYWNGSDSTTQIATKTITASNCTLGGATSTDGTVNSATEISNSLGYAEFDASIGTEGSISFWFKPEYAFNDSINHILVGQYVDATDRLEIVKRNGNTLYFYIGSANVDSSAVDWATSTWHHIRASWKRVDGSNDYMELWLDGESVAVSNSESIPADFDLSTFRIGNSGNYSTAQAVFDELYLTDSADTPEIPTAFGVPLVAPQIAVAETGGNSLKLIETDYDIAPLNEIGTYLVTYHGTLQDDTTFLFTESLNPPQASDPVVPLGRIHPLISTTYTSGYSTITVQRGDGSYADDFKLIFSEADAGVSSCFIGAGTAGTWGSNLCGATNLLTEIDQNSVILTDQTSVLSLIQNAGTEAIIRNYFVLSGEATSTEDWHIFADGSIIIDRNYEKANSNNESRVTNNAFTNNTFYPSTPAIDRVAGVYQDSYFLHLTSVNTDRQNDYLNAVQGATSSISGLTAEMGVDYDSDGFAESYGAYVSDASYAQDPSIPVCSGTCGQPIYHTIGTTSAEVAVTVATVDTIQTEIFAITFSGSPDLSGIHKRDKFTDSGANDWNIILIDDENDQIMVGDQEQNGGTPATGAGTVGPWYNSLFDWEAAEDRNLTSTARYVNGEIEMVECWPMTEKPSSSIDVNGWITTDNNFVKIYTPLLARHKGVLSSDYFLINVDTSGVLGLKISSNYVRIDGLQIDMSDGDRAGIENQGSFDGVGTDIRITNNIVKASANTTYDSGIFISDSDITKILIAGNVISNADYGSGGGNANGTGIFVGNNISNNAEVYIVNNTIYGCTMALQSVDTYGKAIVKNTITNNCDDNFYGYSGGIFSSLSNYNISDIGDAPGDNSRTCAVSFISTSTGDFHLASDDTCAKGYGTPVSHNTQLVTHNVYSDIDGETRPSNSWDIGADQIVNVHANKFKIEFSGADQTVYQPRFLIHDFYPQSGKSGSVEEYVIAHLPLDSLVNTNYVYDKISGSSTLFEVNNYGNVDFQYSQKGKGIKIATSTNSSISFNNSIINRKKGSVSFVYTPLTDTLSLPGGNSGFFFVFEDDNGVPMSGRRTSSNNIMFYYGDDSLSVSEADGNFQFKRDVPIYINFSWYDDGVNAYKYIMADSKIVGIEVNTNRQDTLVNNGIIGNFDVTESYEIEGTIDEFKIYSEPILPFGAFYTGFEQNNSYAYADPSLLFYWDAESETANYPSGKNANIHGTVQLSNERNIVGDKSLLIDGFGANYEFFVNNNDIIQPNKGSVSFWFYPTSSALNNLFRGYIDGENLFTISELDSSGDSYIRAAWRAQNNVFYLNGTEGDINTNAWNWVKLTWDEASDELKLYINGMQSGSTQTISYDLLGSFNSFYIGDSTYDWNSNYYIDQIFITNNSQSQEIPTAFGKPLNIPLMKVNNTRQRYGYDYWVSFTPDPSSVILQYFKDVSDLTEFEVGAGEGYSQVKNLRGGVRLEGGVRF